MRYEDWEPLYLEICEYFSFDPCEDERAAHVAADLSSADATTDLAKLISGNTGYCMWKCSLFKEPGPGRQIKWCCYRC